MTQFFFDVDDGDRQFHDEVGRDLFSLDVAVHEAVVLLRSIAAINVSYARPGITYVTVRDAKGRMVHRGSTQLEG